MNLIKLTKTSNRTLDKSAQIMNYRYIRTDLFLSNPKGEDEAMKVAIYCRLSEEDKNKLSKEDDSESIQNQKSMLIEYAVQKEWEIYNIYSDDDYTGADRNRPAFNQLLKDAEQHKFDIVLCKTQSRFTRELEIVEKYIHGLFPIWNIRFISIVDNADTENKGNKKARQINGLINEWYLEDMSDNIKSVLTNKRRNGSHIGAFALYGYQKDPNQKGHLIIDEEAAQVVREVFTLFSQGMGKSSIARYLNEKGIPNPTEYKRLHGLRYKPPVTKQSTLWRYFAVADMLINEIYIGNMVQGKYGSVSYKSKKNKPIPKEQWIRVEGTHEPIIDMDLWNTVQEMIKQKAKPFSNGEIGIFAKKARCMYCGYVMRSTKSHERRYLKCATKNACKDACIGSFISVSVLEEYVLSELKNLSAKYLDMDELEKNVVFNQKLDEKKQILENQLREYQAKMVNCSTGIKTLYLDKVKGILTEDDFIQLSADLHKDKSTYENLISELSSQIAEIEKKQTNTASNKEQLEEYLSLEHLTHDIVNQLIDCIIVGKRDPETKEIPIEINWKF